MPLCPFAIHSLTLSIWALTELLLINECRGALNLQPSSTPVFVDGALTPANPTTSQPAEWNMATDGLYPLFEAFDQSCTKDRFGMSYGKVIRVGVARLCLRLLLPFSSTQATRVVPDSFLPYLPPSSSCSHPHLKSVGCNKVCFLMLADLSVVSLDTSSLGNYWIKGVSAASFKFVSQSHCLPVQRLCMRLLTANTASMPSITTAVTY